MIEWVKKGDDWETTIGYTRIQLWRPVDQGWKVSLYNTGRDDMNRDRLLHTRNINYAKKRACKFLIGVLTDQRDTIDAWLKQLKD